MNFEEMAVNLAGQILGGLYVERRRQALEASRAEVINCHEVAGVLTACYDAVREVFTDANIEEM